MRALQNTWSRHVLSSPRGILQSRDSPGSLEAPLQQNDTVQLACFWRAAIIVHRLMYDCAGSDRASRSQKRGGAEGPVPVGLL